MIQERLFYIGVLLLIPILLICQESGLVQIEDGELHYKVYGEGFPLLFLNGGPGFSSDCYEEIADHLKSDRKVILFDQRGTGRSEIREVNESTINISKMIQDVEALRKHLDIEQWDILGQSFGGTYAMYYVAQYGDRVNKLILSSTAAPRLDRYVDFRAFTYLEQEFIKEDNDLITELNQRTEILLREARKDSLSINEIERIENESSKRLTMGLRAKYFVYKKENVPLAIEWFANKCKNDSKINKLVHLSLNLITVKERLEQFDKEVLILHGDNDFIQLAAPRNLHQLFSNSTLEILKDCGHLIWIDQAEKTKKLIFDFLI